MSIVGTPEHEDSCYVTVLKVVQGEISEAFAGPLAPYLARILETQPLDTCRMREMSQGLAPECANSTIF
ncbi:hypothetical protein E2C01_059606 [Portunus trituberculatus]|uniref:Uncharacterized protein n=1 Tax=Portunus trituberculatus TaxID=210409 RepID=A0A5B7H312_PORTR|nr:hypothetical protein [Portunus trituberculatus]